MAGGIQTTDEIDEIDQIHHFDEKGNEHESSETIDRDAPTDEERQTLRKVSDKLPWSAFLVALVELCERFAYYGLSGPFQVTNLSETEWLDKVES